MANPALVSTDVLVVGAGPTGLMLANWLVRLGIRALVVDHKIGPTRESRAIVVQARSLEVYDQLGVGATVAARGRQVVNIGIWSQDARAAQLYIGQMGAGLTPHPYAFVLEQSQNEQILCSNLEVLGGQVAWQNTLESLVQHAGGVAAIVRRPDGTQQQIQARFLCGADGARSQVRHLLGIPFEGSTNDQRFYVADVTTTGSIGEGELNIKLDRSTFVLAIPMSGLNHFRLIGVTPAGDQHGEQLEFAHVHSQIAQLGLHVDTVHWFSSYRVSHRVAAHFRQGQVFLLGDAAHVHSPVGGQGMNTGLLDAHNLAWKLAAVLHRTAGDRLLDSYEAERRPFAQRLVRTTDRAFDVIVNPNPVWRNVRSRLFPALIRLAAGRPGQAASAPQPRRRAATVPSALFGIVSQIGVNYRGGPLSLGRVGRIRGGDRLPFVPLARGNNFEVLGNARPQVHVYGPAAPALLAWAQQHAEIRLHVFPASAAARKAGLQPGAVYLVRPDGYISVAMATFDAAAIDQVLHDRWDWRAVQPPYTSVAKEP